ncbi:MAG: DUF4265 domain-containing protein [Acidobacteria bacterium]|nr:DUF4265 domain-containing protein [Acidobacteriota bacterium]
MMRDTESTRIVVHDFPAWRDKANFIIASYLGDDSEVGDLVEWEQIWAQQIAQDRFEICCIPFFAYDLALGDKVVTRPFNSKEYVIDSIIQKSGHRTYRLTFFRNDKWNETIEDIMSLGCLVESRWARSKMISIDAATPEKAVGLEKYLNKLEGANEITWESGFRE